MDIVESPRHRQSQAARINPDSRAVLFLVVGITTALALVSFVVSFAGLMAVAQWAALPPYLWWALPVFIDGAIIVYTMSMLVFRQRGSPPPLRGRHSLDLRRFLFLQMVLMLTLRVIPRCGKPGSELGWPV